MQTTEQQSGPRAGLFRRILFGDPAVAHPDTTSADAPTARSAYPDDLIDVRSLTPPDMTMVYLRLERVERRIDRIDEGLRLIAETMKRACGELLGAVQTIQPGASVGEVYDLLGAATDPLRASLHQMSGTVQAFPHLVAAAAADLSERLEALGASPASASTTGDSDRPVEAPAAAPFAPAVAAPTPQADLPAAPFDLDAFELGFDLDDGGA